MSDFGLEVKFDEFSAFCRNLAEKLGDATTLQTVIDYEVAKILEKTISLTGKADRNKIQSRVKNRTSFMIGDKRWVTRDWKTGQGWRLPDAVWMAVEAKRARSLVRKLNKIGLSKNSWWLLAQKAGFIIEVPAYVASARAQFQDVTTNVSVIRQTLDGNYGIQIENRMPILRFDPVGGTQALFAAVAGRINFFKKNVQHGVFKDIESIAQKYPGLIVEESDAILEDVEFDA